MQPTAVLPICGFFRGQGLVAPGLVCLFLPYPYGWVLLSDLKPEHVVLLPSCADFETCQVASKWWEKDDLSSQLAAFPLDLSFIFLY